MEIITDADVPIKVPMNAGCTGKDEKIEECTGKD